MVNVKELRIGNWVSLECNTEPPQTEYLRIGYVIENDDWKFLNPIPLTPEILKKTKFYPLHDRIHAKKYKAHNGYYIQLNTDKALFLDFAPDGRVITGLETRKNFMWMGYIRYLHELQNLYFKLTDDELEVNLRHA